MKNPVLKGSSKVTKKGQVTIPKDIREQFNINPGDTIYFLLEDSSRIILQKGPIKLS